VNGDELEGYRQFQIEGDSYLKVGRNARNRPGVFTPEIRFNVLSMSIEKHCMAVLMQAGMLPENHTFHDLTRSLDLVAPLEPETVAFLHRMDTVADICSLSSNARSIPEEQNLERLLAIAESMRDLADALLGPVGADELLTAPGV